jgi:hypothetical protein
MKHILRRNKKFSFQFIIFIVIIFICLISAFFISVRYLTAPKNDTAELILSSYISPPECSQSAGFYSKPFTIQLKSNKEDHIYYSLDGSVPTLSSLLYTGEISINPRLGEKNYLSEIPTSPRWLPPMDDVFKGTVLRAIVVDNKNHKSKELIRTFFIDERSFKRYSVPVVAITVNENDFFGYKHGIYVLGKSYGDKDNYIRKGIPLNLPWWEYPSNYLMRGDDAERFAHLEFFEPTGKMGFESNVGIRIHGNATRGYAQKSLRICFKEKYGQAILKYNLFPENKIKQFNSFLLRNSGNDWDKTMFRDGLMQSLMKDSYIDIQADRPCVVFFNGEYWGIHNLRERFDENYLANKYHISVDSITILELNGIISYGKKGEEETFKNLLTFVKQNDLSVKSNYEFVKKQIDIRSFIDFLIANIFYCNGDWPNNNVKFWRFKTSFKEDSLYTKDGRWRWMLYDTDWGFGYNSQSTPECNLLEKAAKTGSVGVMFSGLMKNEEFTDQFTKRFQYLLNTVFSSKNLLSEIDKMERIMAPEIQEQIDRWRAIRSYNKWLENVEVLRDFAKKRPEIQAAQLNSFFNLNDTRKIRLEN